MLTVLVLLASVAATARADQPLWQQPVPVDRNPPFAASEPLSAISCPSATACLAFGIGGQILSSTDPAQGLGSWSTTTLDDEHGSVQAASCPSTSLCIAVDRAGDVITSTNPFAPEPRWRVVKIDHANDGTLWSISCPTVSLCVTTDVQGDVLSSTEPTGGPGAWHTARVQETLPGQPPPGGLLGISCPTAKFCAAVDRLGEVFTSIEPADGSKWQRTQLQFPSSSQPDLYSISCPSPSLCVAGGDGTIATSTDPTGGLSAWNVVELPLATDIATISCTDGAACVAGGSEVLLGSSNATGGRDAWTIVHEPAIRNVLTSACPSSERCLLGTGFGRMLATSAPARSSIGWTESLIMGYNTPTALSCTASFVCVLADISGAILTTANPLAPHPVWRERRIDGNANLTAVSCVSPSACVAVDNAGNAFATSRSTDAGSWHGAPIDDGHSLAGVSCATRLFCVAVDDAGAVAVSSNATTNGARWERRQVDSNALLAISCPVRTFCLASDDAGNMLTSTSPQTGRWMITALNLPPVVDRIGPGSNPPPPPPATVTHVSCASPSMCMGTAADGLAITSRRPTAGAGAWTRASIGEMSGVSCPSVSLCVAVDYGGHSLSSTQPTSLGSWTSELIDYEAIMNYPGDLTAVSCGSPSYCLATTYFGNTLLALDGPGLRALLRHAIEPTSHRLRASVVMRRGFSSSLRSPATGTLAVRWLLRAPRSGRHPGGRARRIVIATGRTQLEDGRPAKVRMTLTARGVAAIKRSSRLDLRAVCVLTPQSGQPIRASGTFVITAR